MQAFIAMTCDNSPVYAFAIYNDDIVVGFIQICYSDDWRNYEREAWLNSDVFKQYQGKKYYAIWRFMIDEKYQHKGYGREAFRLALEFIKTKPSGDAEYMCLSYELENIVARKLYASFGFYEPEEFAPYYEKDDEITALLKM